MKNEEEMKNCLESFERRCKIEQNPETLKMWNILRIYTEFILDRRGQMRYDGYSIESDLDVDPLPRAQVNRTPTPTTKMGVEK